MESYRDHDDRPFVQSLMTGAGLVERTRPGRSSKESRPCPLHQGLTYPFPTALDAVSFIPRAEWTAGLLNIAIDAANGSEEAAMQLSAVEYGWYQLARWQDCWAAGLPYSGRWSAGRYE